MEKSLRDNVFFSLIYFIFLLIVSQNREGTVGDHTNT